jgi:hypothetical protein
MRTDPDERRVDMQDPVIVLLKVHQQKVSRGRTVDGRSSLSRPLCKQILCHSPENERGIIPPDDIDDNRF